jgi:hypothetical protein
MSDDAVDLKYTRDARMRDVLVCVALAMILGSVVAPLVRRFVDDDVGLAFVLACYAGALAPLVLVAGLWRWGRRGRADADGVAISASSSGPVQRLAWAEVDEIFALGSQGFELRGNGKAVRVSTDFDGVDRAFALFQRHRAASLAESIGRTLDAGGTVRFRGPLETSAAIVQGLIHIVVFTPVLMGPWLLIPKARPFDGREAWFFTLCLVAVALAVMLVVFLRSKARDCGWVEVGPDGLAYRLAGRPRRFRWDEVASAGADAAGRLILQSKAGDRAVVPLTFGNFPYLVAALHARGAAKEGA